MFELEAELSGQRRKSNGTPSLPLPVPPQGDHPENWRAPSPGLVLRQVQRGYFSNIEGFIILLVTYIASEVAAVRVPVLPLLRVGGSGVAVNGRSSKVARCFVDGHMLYHFHFALLLCTCLVVGFLQGFLLCAYTSNARVICCKGIFASPGLLRAFADLQEDVYGDLARVLLH